MEFLRDHTRLPIGEERHLKFTLQEEQNEMYRNFESAVYGEPGDHYDLAAQRTTRWPREFGEQIAALVREYKGDGEYLSVHHPDTRGAVKEHPNDIVTLMGRTRGAVGDILFVWDFRMFTRGIVWLLQWISWRSAPFPDGSSASPIQSFHPNSR